jgi:hypothetical protein
MTQLVRVWTDVGTLKPAALLARVVDEKDGVYKIQYFSPTEEQDHGRVIYRYEDETYEIDDESITEYLDSDETDIGFVLVGEDAWVKGSSDSDEDYVPSEEEDDDEEDEEDDEDEEDESPEEYLDEE